VNNDAGFAALDDMIRRLRQLPAEFQAAAPGIAVEMKAESTRAIAAGESLDGVKWAPKKDGGGQALVNAAKSVRTYVSGEFIYLELSGVEVIHHYGTSRVPARPFWPMHDGMPTKLGQAIRRGYVKIWDQGMRRAG
jgi:hypothetical protein